MFGYIDHPTASEKVDPLCFAVEGWVHGGDNHAAIDRIEIHSGGTLLGFTRALGPRPDVCTARKFPAGTRTGFRIFCQWKNPANSAEIEATIRFKDGSTASLSKSKVTFAGFDHRKMPFGHVLDSDFLPIVHREHVYTSGPSHAEGSTECLELLGTHLPSPPAKLVDIGCGLGWYGKALRKSGYDWMGVEKKPEDCQALAAAGIPHRQVDGDRLPFADGSFDAALAIEVLEHVERPEEFLRETSRVAPRLFISVPNFEVVSYLYRWRTLPWHLLEADHRNFFTRWSLHHLLSQFYRDVEVGCYHRLELVSPEGTALYYNLFASATR